jgi:hypothetical protein
MVAGERVVGDEHVEPTLRARELVAARAPVLPQPHLATRALLPHGASVVKTPRPLAVTLQREVFLRLCNKSVSFILN